jgi:hypothetical protein
MHSAVPDYAAPSPLGAHLIVQCRDLIRPTACRRDDPDLWRATQIGDEGNARAIRRETGVGTRADACRERNNRLQIIRDRWHRGYTGRCIHTSSPFSVRLHADTRMCVSIRGVFEALISMPVSVSWEEAWWWRTFVCHYWQKGVDAVRCAP